MPAEDLFDAPILRQRFLSLKPEYITLDVQTLVSQRGIKPWEDGSNDIGRYVSGLIDRSKKLLKIGSQFDDELTAEWLRTQVGLQDGSMNEVDRYITAIEGIRRNTFQPLATFSKEQLVSVFASFSDSIPSYMEELSHKEKRDDITPKVWQMGFDLCQAVESYNQFGIQKIQHEDLLKIAYQAKGLSLFVGYFEPQFQEAWMVYANSFVQGCNLIRFHCDTTVTFHELVKSEQR